MKDRIMLHNAYRATKDCHLRKLLQIESRDSEQFADVDVDRKKIEPLVKHLSKRHNRMQFYMQIWGQEGRLSVMNTIELDGVMCAICAFTDFSAVATEKKVTDIIALPKILQGRSGLTYLNWFCKNRLGIQLIEPEEPDDKETKVYKEETGIKLEKIRRFWDETILVEDPVAYLKEKEVYIPETSPKLEYHLPHLKPGDGLAFRTFHTVVDLGGRPMKRRYNGQSKTEINIVSFFDISPVSKEMIPMLKEYRNQTASGPVDIGSGLYKTRHAHTQRMLESETYVSYLQKVKEMKEELRPMDGFKRWKEAVESLTTEEQKRFTGEYSMEDLKGVKPESEQQNTTPYKVFRNVISQESAKQWSEELLQFLRLNLLRGNSPLTGDQILQVCKFPLDNPEHPSWKILNVNQIKKTSEEMLGHPHSLCIKGAADSQFGKALFTGQYGFINYFANPHAVYAMNKVVQEIAQMSNIHGPIFVVPERSRLRVLDEKSIKKSIPSHTDVKRHPFDKL